MKPIVLTLTGFIFFLSAQFLHASTEKLMLLSVAIGFFASSLMVQGMDMEIRKKP